MRFCVFFFSSRRRHTRSLCDWSSDVCSSDLEQEGIRRFEVLRHPRDRRGGGARASQSWCHVRDRARQPGDARGGRSEERRVGKECRPGGSPYHSKKKHSEKVERHAEVGKTGK